jgi:outer membrane protein TolC
MADRFFRKRGAMPHCRTSSSRFGAFPPRIGPAIFIVLFAGVFSGCAQYQPITLPTQPDYVGTPANTDLAGHPLSLAQIQHRVVMDNPDLKAARMALTVSEAGVRQAGALPDPGLSVALDHPMNGVGLVNALNQSISLDISSLITRGPRLDAARAERLRTRLGLSWQVLTTEALAVNADIELIATNQQLAMLDRDAKAVNARLGRSREALSKGFITQDVVAAEVVRSADLARQQDDLRLRRTTLSQQLNALMGLAPNTRWSIPDQLPAFKTLSAHSVHEILPQLSLRRPDLLAFRAGIQRADSDYRAAILQQFPGLTVGLSRANDTSNVQTAGFSIGLSLPIFGSAQAQVARTKATRAQLVAEFQARIDQAHADVAQMRSKLDNLNHRLAQIDQRLPTLVQTAAHAQTALDAGYFSAGSYLAVRASLTAERLNRIQTRQAIAQTEIALATMLGQPLQISPSDTAFPRTQP